MSDAIEARIVELNRLPNQAATLTVPGWWWGRVIELPFREPGGHEVVELELRRDR